MFSCWTAGVVEYGDEVFGGLQRRLRPKLQLPLIRARLGLPIRKIGDDADRSTHKATTNRDERVRPLHLGRIKKGASECPGRGRASRGAVRDKVCFHPTSRRR